MELFSDGKNKRSGWEHPSNPNPNPSTIPFTSFHPSSTSYTPTLTLHSPPLLHSTLPPPLTLQPQPFNHLLHFISPFYHLLHPNPNPSTTSFTSFHPSITSYSPTPTLQPPLTLHFTLLPPLTLQPQPFYHFLYFIPSINNPHTLYSILPSPLILHSTTPTTTTSISTP
jgi:hypothetical protein